MVAFGALTAETRWRVLVEDTRAVIVWPDHCAQLVAIAWTYFGLTLEALRILIAVTTFRADAMGLRFTTCFVVRILFAIGEALTVTGMPRVTAFSSKINMMALVEFFIIILCLVAIFTAFAVLFRTRIRTVTETVNTATKT